MTERRLDAPSGRFAELLRRCEELLADDSITRVSFVGNDHLLDMVKCIRQQRVALSALAEGVDNYTVDLLKRNGMLITNGLAEAQNEARAVLEKWKLP